MVALANFEHLKPPSSAARRRIIDDIFSKKIFGLYLAMDKTSGPIGYALYFFTYSSFLAKPTLYLEDLFVLEGHRKRGVGKALFKACAKEAVRNGCGRMEWNVLTWNENAINFYEKLGAKRLDEWYYYRLTSETLRNILRQ
ncbi:MAG: GNAT family N-acetyltransferase [Thaumarchaeota archaeon]|nr:GNAT family N-acetyltransferase [Nitrososphaerota archaeon]